MQPRSDHVCIEFQYVLGEADLNEPVDKLNYWKADYDKINDALSSVDWSVEFSGKDCNEMWESFCEKINTTVSQHVSFKKVRNAQEKSPWMTRLTRRMIKKRNKAWNIYRQFSSTRNFNRYKCLRNRVCKRIKQDKSDYQRNMIEKFNGHPKLFYGYMRNATTVRSKVPNIARLHGTLTKDNGEAASVLCDYFCSTFVREADSDGIGIPYDNDFILTVTRDDVLKSLSKLRPDKSPGPDNMHPMLLRETAQNIAEPLTLIFQRSVKDGRVPDDWKRANITPIHKRDQNAKLRIIDLYP